MYRLQAVVAPESVLRELAQARVVPLAQSLSLLPLTEELDSRLLAAASTHGPVAYVEAEYFGGTGSQTAEVWDAGKVILGPLHLDAEDWS